MTKPYTCHRKYYAPLEQVATIATVARLWHRSWGGVRYAIDAGNIAAVKDGKTWLISIPSVVAFWGEPPRPIGAETPLSGAGTALQIRGQNGDRDNHNSRAQSGVSCPVCVLRDGIYQQAERCSDVLRSVSAETLQTTATAGQEPTPG